MKMYRRKYFGNTLLEGVCIRLTRHLHNHDMTYVMNMKEVLCMFMTTVIMCHLLSYDIFYASLMHTPSSKVLPIFFYKNIK